MARNVPFREVINLAATKLGLDPAFVLPESERRAITEYINTWAEEAWEKYPWPDLIEEKEDVPLTNGGFDLSLVDDGAVTYVGRRKPSTYNRSVQQLPFRLVGTKVYVNPTVLSNVYVEYRTAFVSYPSEVYDPTRPYTAGDKAYWADEGEAKIYDGATWSLIRFPAFLKVYVGFRAAAEAKREAGDLQGSGVDEGRANSYLEEKLDDLEIVQGQRRRYQAAYGDQRRGVDA